MSAWFSFHGGHSGEFCRHASGRLEAVLESALERGFTSYGLSEHGPRDRARDLTPDEADLQPSDLHAIFRRYVASAREWAGRLEGSLEVLVGFETEVVPRDGYADRVAALREELRFDYVVGSVHHVEERCIDLSPDATRLLEGELGGPDSLDRAYFDQLGEMVESVRPEVVGHFDLVRLFRGPDPGFSDETWPHIQRALEAVAAAGSLLDVNAAPVRKRLGPPYPIVPILERARRLGIAVTLGDDSHGPADVGSGLDACIRAIGEAGYREVSRLRRTKDGTFAQAIPIEQVRPVSRPPSRAPDR